MSAIAGLVDVTKSMIVIDPDRFPVNLQKVYREDLPDASFKILAYDARNVMPTANGYRSYFSNYTLLGINPVPSDYCQWVLTYQTADYSTILIAACEEGLYWCGATQGDGPTDWQQVVVGNSVNPAAPVFHLWTHAVIANKLYVYCQGQDKFYCFGTIADIDNLVSQATNFPEAKVTKTGQSSAKYKFAIASIVPTFLNMVGQIGLFRADNRLGFWDSDNAVAWSSAIYIPDFEPSTETFAGVTTFADVVGAITMIYGHGNDFVIYSTRSIVKATNVEGSSEKWSGSAILSDTGVSFYNQIAPGQPDTTQYALTSSGLCRIQNGVPQFFETEVSDYLMEENDYYALSYIDGRYLFMHSTNALVPSVVSVDADKVVDATNGTYYFNHVTDNSNSSMPAAIANILNGSDSAVQQDFKRNAVPTNASNNGAAAGATMQPRSLMPCYSGGEFKSSWDDDAVEFKRDNIRSFYPESTIEYWDPLAQLNIETKLAPGSFYDFKEANPIPVPDLTFSDPNAENRFFDKAGDQFQDLLTKNIVRINKMLQGVNDFLRYAQTPQEISLSPANIPTLNPKAVPNSYTEGNIYGTVKRKKFFERKVNGLVRSQDLKWTMNNCVYECALNKKVNAKITAYISGTEVLELNLISVVVPGFGFGYVNTGVKVGETKPFMIMFDKDFWTEADSKAFRAFYAPGGEADKYFDFSRSTRPGDNDSMGMIVYLFFKSPSRLVVTEGGPSAASLSATYIDWTTMATVTHTSINGTETFQVNKALQQTKPEWRHGVADNLFKFTQLYQKNSNVSHSRYTIKPDGPLQGNMGTAYDTGQVIGISDTYEGGPGGYWSPPHYKSELHMVDVVDAKGNVSHGQGGYKEIPITQGGGTISVRVDQSSGWLPFITLGLGGTYIEPFDLSVGEWLSLSDPDRQHIPMTQEQVALSVVKAAQRKPRTAWKFYARIEYEIEIEEEDAGGLHLFKADNSGWGYMVAGSFTKTHTRGEGSNVCIPGNYGAIKPNPTPEDAGNIGKEPIINLPTIPGIQPPEPPVTWPYPGPVNIPDTSALFRKGTPAPFYPTYEAAIVYDFLLEKYGRYSNKHKEIYSLLPTNRADSTVTPTRDLGLRGGFLRPDRKLGYFSNAAPDSEIVYGRFGSYRLGITRGTKAVARFNGKTTGTIIVECSLNGATVDEGLTQALEFKDAVTVEFYFTRTAKWFNIRIRGKFDLIGLSFESDPRGRR